MEQVYAGAGAECIEGGGVMSEIEALQKAHGSPAEFAAAVWCAVPWFISVDEAEEAIAKYEQEWREAEARDAA